MQKYNKNPDSDNERIHKKCFNTDIYILKNVFFELKFLKFV